MTVADYGGMKANMTYSGVGSVTEQRITSQMGSSLYMRSTSTYSSDGNLPLSATAYGSFKNASGSTVTSATTSYNYGSGTDAQSKISRQTAQPLSVTNAKGVATTNTYDTNNGRIASTSVASTAQISYNYDNAGRLNKLTIGPNGSMQEYNLSYDAFGNTTSIKVGTQTIASYAYGPHNGNRTSMTYGNGTTENYTYDILGRPTNCSIGSSFSDRYVYSGEGPLKQRTTTAGSTTLTTNYTYDVLNRLIAMSRSDNTNSNTLNASYTYNNYNQMSGYGFSINGIVQGANTTLDYFINDEYACADGLPSHVGLPNGANVWYNFADGFVRLNAQRVGPVKYQYAYNDGSTYASPNVSSLIIRDGAHNDAYLFQTNYTYDVLGNILNQTTNGVSVNYTYDALNQLTSAGSDVFTYDNRGNLLTKTSSGTTHTYTYGNTQWKDQLTKYDNHTITYDGAGNPLSYYNGSSYTFTWVNGRQLASAVKGGTTTTYGYDGDGLRTIKKVGSDTTHYAWSNGVLLAQWKTNASNAVTEKIVFLYDNGSTPVGFLYTTGSSTDVSTWTPYYYAKNNQGDVLYIYGANMNLVASYTYDAWGKVLSATGTMANINPIRYRSYYYDTDTGLYYLQSRYYDPEIGRFINADVFISTDITGPLSANMYAYCENNPVNASDCTGNYPVFLERLFDYAAMHTMTQIMCASERGWEMERYISGPNGNGRLDLYDSVNNQYYEVKSKGAYDSGQHKEQMEKYDSGTVKSSGLTPTRGTKVVSGSFQYGIYDVSFYTAEPGIIVYEPKVNTERAAMFAVLGICAVITIVAPEVGIPLTTAVGTYVCT